MTNKAQVIKNLGPPEVMQWQDWPINYPIAGEVRLRHTAIGVNFADTYHRAGISHPWPVPNPPVVIGFEGVGIIDSKLTTIGVWLANRDKETNEILERTPTSDFQRGVVYYLKDNVVVGVILWNASDQMNKAREIVNDKKILNQSNVANELQKMISLAPEESLDIIQS